MSQAKSELPACRCFMSRERSGENTMDQARLKELLHYCPDTGVFTWRSTGKPAGSCKGHRYVRITISGKHYYAHRLAWVYVYGESPPLHIDHINHDSTDNRLENLRQVTRSENGQNAALSRANSSGYRGVSRDRRRGKWVAYINLARKKKHLGSFDDVSEAAKAYALAAAKIHTHNPEAI
jgi:hypothetical protein